MVKNLLITGLPGVGKTTLIKKLVNELGIRADGFFTSEIREAGKRVGFWVEDFKGAKELLASVDFPSSQRVGKYGVNVEGFEKIALPSLRRALGEAQLVVIDEIGKMELFSQAFRSLLDKVLDSRKPVLATILKKSHPYTDKIKARPDVEVFNLTPSNRREVYEKLKSILEDLI